MSLLDLCLIVECQSSICYSKILAYSLSNLSLGIPGSFPPLTWNLSLFNHDPKIREMAAHRHQLYFIWQHIAIGYILSSSKSPSVMLRLATYHYQLSFTCNHITIHYISSGISQLGLKLISSKLDHKSVSEMGAHHKKLYLIWQQIAFSFQFVQCHAWPQIAINIPSNSVSTGLTLSSISCQFNLSRILSFWTFRISVIFPLNTLVHRALSGPASYLYGVMLGSKPPSTFQQSDLIVLTFKISAMSDSAFRAPTLIHRTLSGPAFHLIYSLTLLCTYLEQNRLSFHFSSSVSFGSILL